jgi:uncharacterized membrane protein
MLGWWSLVRFVHVVSAMVWVGGQLTISAMLLPVVRRTLDLDGRASVLTGVGRRFGRFTVAVFIPLQVSSGIALAWHKGVTIPSLADPGYGRTLAAKLVAFVLVMLAAGVHGWAMGTRRQTLARALAIASLVGSLAIVLLATALPRS